MWVEDEIFVKNYSMTPGRFCWVCSDTEKLNRKHREVFVPLPFIPKKEEFSFIWQLSYMIEHYHSIVALPEMIGNSTTIKLCLLMSLLPPNCSFKPPSVWTVVFLFVSTDIQTLCSKVAECERTIAQLQHQCTDTVESLTQDHSSEKMLLIQDKLRLESSLSKAKYVDYSEALIW